MIYNELCSEKVSGLGFGAMRLPLKADQSVDRDEVCKMIDYSMKMGINYYDTAWPYHNGESETALCEALAKYPRDSYFLADKFPGHQIAATHYPKDIFEQQLAKCKVDYFDFYLLHNIYENSIDTYMDPKWGILDYFLEQKRLGRIRHLGFSTHSRPESLKRFLEYCGKQMDFCQIQLNYLDWTLQEAEKKLELLKEYDLPIVVMEPLRGGRLANLSDDEMDKLKSLRPDLSAAAWSFKWLQNQPQVKVTLSGMSTMEQVEQNIVTYADNENPLTDAENKVLFELAEGMKNSVPCTACRYCCKGCPVGLDIPFLIRFYNDIKFQPAFTVGMQMEALPQDKQPSACVNCGACSITCPQHIDVPAIMADFAERLTKIPKWAEICRQREEGAKKLQRK